MKKLNKQPILRVKDLCKTFDSHLEVLKGINFEIARGEILSIIGSSGSGKTTLLRCLNFLETAESGSIIVDGNTLFNRENGVDIDGDNKISLRQKRLNFGMVFQNFNLFPQYNTLKNIYLPLYLQGYEKWKKENPRKSFKERLGAKQKVKEESKAQAKEILCQVGLIDKLENYPFQLSGGQQQRVAIARALALKPKILCFDEPTSALDPELTNEVLKVIKSLKSPERTMIIVTHEMSFAREISDKVIFMADGVIEEMGSPEEVFGRPKSPKTKAFLLQLTDGEAAEKLAEQDCLSPEI